MLNVLARMWFGLAVAALILVGSIVVLWITGPIYDRWDWREVTIALLILGVLSGAGFVEAFRPQNPYKNLNPLYGMMDVAQTGKLDSGGSGWLWNVVPPIALALALLLLF